MYVLIAVVVFPVSVLILSASACISVLSGLITLLSNIVSICAKSIVGNASTSVIIAEKTGLILSVLLPVEVGAAGNSFTCCFIVSISSSVSVPLLSAVFASSRLDIKSFVLSDNSEL